MAKRTSENLSNQLKTQLQLLQAACESYDRGSEIQALNIATRLRLLLHDTDKSHSLLKQLGVKDKMEFLDSSLPIDPQPQGGNRFIFHALPGFTGITTTRNGGKFVPALSLREGAKGPVPFSEWWESAVVPGDKGLRYSRRKLITHVANKEGGAHVHPDYDHKFNELMRNYTGGMTIRVNGKKTGFVNSASDAAIRQIAWEFFESTAAESDFPALP